MRAGPVIRTVPVSLLVVIAASGSAAAGRALRRDAGVIAILGLL
jgi:hypothetical protein